MKRIAMSRRGVWFASKSGSRRLVSWRAFAFLVALPFVFATAMLFAVSQNSILPEFIGSLLNGGKNSSGYTIEPKAAFNLFAQHLETSLDNVFAIDDVTSQSALPTLHIVIEGNALHEMQKAIQTGSWELDREPGGVKPYFKGHFLDEHGVFQRCKVSYRGVSKWHHWNEKPSLRIKIKKDDVVQGFRYFDLERPEDGIGLRGYVPSELARKLGVMASPREHVRLFINRKYYGVYLRGRRMGEPLALNLGHMPGCFFKGDSMMERAGLDLWSQAANWRRYGEDNQQASDAFNHLLQILQSKDTRQVLPQLREILDYEKFALCCALKAFLGDFKDDLHHNHAYFYCSTTGKIEPLIWDALAMGTSPAMPINCYRHPLSEMLARDPDFILLRDQALWRLVNEIFTAKSYGAYLDAIVSHVMPDLKTDDNLAYIDNEAGTAHLNPLAVDDIQERFALVRKTAMQRIEAIQDRLNEAQVYASPSITFPGWTEICVTGHTPLQLTTKTAKTPLRLAYVNGSELVTIRSVEQENGVTLVPGQTIAAHASILGSYETLLPEAQPAPLRYFVQATLDEIHISELFSGQSVQLRDVTELDQGQLENEKNLRTLHPWALLPSETQSLTLGPGLVELSKTLVTEKGQSLYIAPGTTIALGPEVSIICQGQLIIDGTDDSPVTISRLDDKKAWGCLSVTGPESAGSRLAYLYTSGGSLGSHNYQHFKGMINAYNVPSITIRNCTFDANSIGDDLVNLVQSEVDVANCTITNALSDGLDLDMCHGRVSSLTVHNSGNDGVDLMGCELRIEDCIFDGCGDKGISCGEGSQVLASRLNIRDCVIGIQVKDGSRLLLESSTIEKCGQGIHAYQKKWFYDGAGKIALVNSQSLFNQTYDLNLEKRSDAYLVRSRVNKVSDETFDGKRLHYVEELGPQWSQLLQQVRD